MKKNKFRYFIAASSIAGGILAVAACSKFLDKTPVGTLSPTVVYNKSGVEGILIGAYSLLDGEGGNGGGWGSAASNWVYGSVCADEAYKGSTPSDQGDIVPLETWTATSTNGYPSGKWSLCYDGVQRANEVLRTIPLAKDLSADDIKEFTAEARFLRGHYHFELKKVFNNAPFIAETVGVDTKPEEVANVDANGNYVNIWPQIIEDLKFAADNLPETQTEIGRVNSWAAKAFLAKAYLFTADYTNAKTVLDDIISKGQTSGGKKYDLAAFLDNFDASKQKDDPEIVFAAQMSVNDGSGTSGTSNGNYGDVLNFPYNAGPGACCGFFNPSQSLANSFKTDANGLPLLDGSYNTGSLISGKTSPYAGNVDPRLDWTMGRPGIPYLDWGLVPTDDSWLRNDQGSNGRFIPKKNVYYKSQKGSLSSTENNWAATQLTANNVNLIRFSDVLLWAAECEIRIGDPEKARTYVNRIRTRAADNTTWVKMDNGNYADKYKIGLYPAGSFNDKTYALNAIVFERRLELAMEGHRFFDLVRWGTASATLNAYAKYENQIKICYIYNSLQTFTPGKSEYFPIPQGQIDALNADGKTNLKQNPGY